MFIRLLIVLLAVALLAPRALACSCGAWWSPDAVTCRGSARAFAGVVQGYDWPLADSVFGSGPGVRLTVDSVWSGEVPGTVGAVTGFGGGDCGIAPAPGTRFVWCDDAAGHSMVPFDSCGHPAFGEKARSIQADLGPAGAPVASRLRLPDREDLIGFAAVVLAALPRALPYVGAAISALIARRLHTRRPLPLVAPRPRRFAVGLCLLAGAVLAGRLVARHLDPWEALPAVVLGVIVVATVAGCVVAWRGQRRPSRYGGPLGGLVATVATIGAVQVPGVGRLHFPIQPADAVACSEARAQALLAALPPRPKPSFTWATWSWDGPEWTTYTAQTAAWEAEIEALEAASCTDWGLAPMVVRANDDGGACVGFPDGIGGMYWRCAGEVNGWYGYEGFL